MIAAVVGALGWLLTGFVGVWAVVHLFCWWSDLKEAARWSD